VAHATPEGGPGESAWRSMGARCARCSAHALPSAHHNQAHPRALAPDPPPGTDQVIRGLIAQQPPRAETQAAIDAESAAIAALEAEQRRHEAALEQKRRAFALLLQCIDDLQRAGGGDDDAGGGGGGPAAMQIDG
jgi:hypothetical protein